MGNEWVDEVLDFWFKELTFEDWFGGSADLDDKIRARFKDLYEEKKIGFPLNAVDDARTALAAIILFDQFPRNMFRKSPAAFGTDDLALGIARRALEKGFDAEAEPMAKPFYYMPFMHSEVSADQERCVDLFRAIGEGDGLKYAIEHRDIVAEYGRFPHRNRALGRESTPAEIAFLEQHAGYGQ
ncbi:DUF924 family protein [Mesorhizobium sp. CAU 1741]|uniref:DUF924 family protein n=1 Tax=Mesorhizobium sp. CAU 1741 TaxID=3140366 RepID=UPI00325B1A7D